MIQNIVGGVAKGRNFFGREAEQRALWEALRRQNQLLLAPRRVGKTSLMHKLLDDSPLNGFRGVYVSVADADDELSFVGKLCSAVCDELPRDFAGTLRRSPIGSFLRRIRKVEVLQTSVELATTAPEDWKQWGDALARVLARGSGRWLLLVDEVPIFVLSLVGQDPSGDRARQFLNWFRTLRQESDRHDQVRWLLAGSIGLDTVTARLRLGDTINDLEVRHLGAFPDSVADSFLVELGRAYQFELEAVVRQDILRRVGWLIPYHLQIVFAEMRESLASGVRDPDLEAIFDQIFSAPKKSYFDYWRQRLVQELGREDSALAMTMLAFCARDAQATRAEILRQLSSSPGDDPDHGDRLRYLLDVLESDGYLVSTREGYQFRSPLIREYWLRRVLA